MTKQERITFLLEIAVENILKQINHSTTIDDKKNLRCQFDAELAWQTGSINCGQHAKIIENHTIN